MHNPKRDGQKHLNPILLKVKYKVFLGHETTHFIMIHKEFASFIFCCRLGRLPPFQFFSYNEKLAFDVFNIDCSWIASCISGGIGGMCCVFFVISFS